MTPETMSPSRPAYSPKVSSFSASRSPLQDHLLGLIAAMRPKSDGVSSYSRRRRRSRRLLREHGDRAELAVDLDPGVRMRVICMAVRREQSGLDRVDDRVERDLFLPLDGAPAP